MAIKKIIHIENIRTPDSYTVECGGHKKMFNKGEEAEIGKWIMSIWDKELIPSDARVFYNIGWDNDHVHYCTYRKEAIT